ncbi:MAG: hypothetical protein M3081_20050 [Gemmatimonadota bacterium]|nr:hypothetical protein [Gemmatimonadota bacterium]
MIFLDVEYMVDVPRAMRDYYVAAAIAAAADENDPPFWIAGSDPHSRFALDKSPADVGHSFATAWQGVLDVVEQPNGHKIPIDVSVASLASPSLAE